MMRSLMMVCLATLAACAGPQAESRLDKQVTRIGGANDGAAGLAALPAAPALQVDAVPPGSDWMVKRNAQTDESPAAVLLINSSPDIQATVAVIMVPTTGTPTEMATVQRDALIKLGVTCSRLIVSKDGSQAGFTTRLKVAPGKIRKGKTVYLLAKGRKDYTAAIYAAWNPKSDKAMLAATDKIAASVTVK